MFYCTLQYVHNVGDDAIGGGGEGIGYHIIRGLSALERLLFAQLCCCFPLRPKCYNFFR